MPRAMTWCRASGASRRGPRGVGGKGVAMAAYCQQVLAMVYSPPHGVSGNSEHSELRPPKGFQTGPGCPPKCDGVCARCDPASAGCVADTTLDTGCCERGQEYEAYGTHLGYSNSRKIFSGALRCVANGICTEVGSPDLNDPFDRWMLCVNAGLYERWSTRQPNAGCWEKAEAFCEALSNLYPDHVAVQQLSCFGSMWVCHDAFDMGDTLAAQCGCGSDSDWARVSQVLAACVPDETMVPHYVTEQVAQWFAKARYLSGCQ
jgi:hypothetical protein